MSDELRAAAEVLKWDCDYNLDYITPAHHRAARDLSNFYLAEHPADDEMPVTESWLESIGFRREPVNDCVMKLETISRTAAWKYDCEYWRVDFQKLPEALYPKTRRDVRQLCRVLGIQIKDGKVAE